MPDLTASDFYLVAMIAAAVCLGIAAFKLTAFLLCVVFATAYYILFGKVWSK